MTTPADDKPKDRQYHVGGLEVIETTADKIYTQRIKAPLHEIGANGANGTLYDKNGTVMILINNGEVIGNNGFWNGWKSPARPVIYYDGKKIRYEIVKSVNDLWTPVSKISWGIGGGSLPYRKEERFGSDVTRIASRTGIGYNGDKVFIISTKDRLSLPEFSERIYSTLNVKKAIFLDGGGSVQMFWHRPIIKSNRPVDNGIFVK